MDRKQLEVWLSTLDPLNNWELDDIELLERQIIRVVRESGYLNLHYILNKGQ